MKSEHDTGRSFQRLIRRELGLLRSVAIYYGMPGRRRRDRAFLASLIPPGELCFDVGAHVGHRSRTLLDLGARCLAVEPQPRLCRLLSRLYGEHRDFILCPMALGASRGKTRLAISTTHPTLSSTEPGWVQTLGTVPGFRSISWDDECEVPVETLDNLIGQYGTPYYCKLDVEGAEATVLQGLTTPISLISFEVLPGLEDRLDRVLVELQRLATYRFRWTRGEEQRLRPGHWVSPSDLVEVFSQLASDRREYEIYAQVTHR